VSRGGWRAWKKRKKSGGEIMGLSVEVNLQCAFNGMGREETGENVIKG